MKKGLIILTTAITIIGIAALTTIKDIQTTEYGTQITFNDNSGYWIEK